METGIITVLVVLAIYFLPTLLASGRKKNIGSIFVVNLFLGWTLIGWVVALAMAAGAKDK